MHFSTAFKAVSLLAALLAPAAAQTWTACNPMERDDCPVMPALGIEKTWNMTNTTLGEDGWNTTNGKVLFSNDQAQFTINKALESPTMQSKFYIFWGTVSVIMKAAPGQGIISSIVLLSDDLDEVDWEFLGGEANQVQTNFYGKGKNQTLPTGANHTVSNPQSDWHNYTTQWTPDALNWFIDGQKVRTLTPADAVKLNTTYPQTPSFVKLGIWPAGDKGNSAGVISWAGGVVDYAKAPFTMHVASVSVTDGTKNATEYRYSDRSGTAKSIKVVEGKSSIAEALTAPPPPTINERFNALSTGAKIAIFASVAAVLLALVVFCFFCCIKNRRAGRRERALEDAKFDKDCAELMAYRKQMSSGQFAQGSSPMPRKF